MGDVVILGVMLPGGCRKDLGVHDQHFVDPSDLIRPETIDADGLIALPGLVDLHTHLRQPGQEAAETISSGTAAAARGGYTAVFAMANTDPVTDNAERVRHVKALAEGAFAEVIPVGAITCDLAGHEVADLEAMHAEGTTYFSDDGKCVMDASVMREALMRASAFSGTLAQHSQDANLAGGTACVPVGFADPSTGGDDPTQWPVVAESVIVARDVELALDTGSHIHVCHVSTAESLEVIRWAKARGAHVTCEVTPHHLLLESARAATRDPLYKVNPPLRGSEDIEALRAALAEGLIDVVATDHAPHTFSDKQKPFPEAKPGMVGLETALAVVIEVMVATGRLTWLDVAERMSYTPARLGQISNHQGRPLKTGELATFTLIDPTRREVVDSTSSASRSRNNPYNGLDLPDPVVATFWAGRRTY